MNKLIEENTPIVPNLHTLLTQISPTATCFSVIDLANAYFSVPITIECQHYFAFTMAWQQYTWKRLPQGMVSSLSEYNAALSQILSQWKPKYSDTVLLQYVDDLLLCCRVQSTCKEETISLLVFLAQTGNKASKQKLQFCQDKVVFLGHCISTDSKHLTAQRAQLIRDYPLPRNNRQLRAFLGLVGYCIDWIPNASQLMAPLYALTAVEKFTIKKLIRKPYNNYNYNWQFPLPPHWQYPITERFCSSSAMN